MVKMHSHWISRRSRRFSCEVVSAKCLQKTEICTKTCYKLAIKTDKWLKVKNTVQVRKHRFFMVQANIETSWWLATVYTLYSPLFHTNFIIPFWLTLALSFILCPSFHLFLLQTQVIQQRLRYIFGSHISDTLFVTVLCLTSMSS